MSTVSQYISQWLNNVYQHDNNPPAQTECTDVVSLATH